MHAVQEPDLRIELHKLKGLVGGRSEHTECRSVYGPVSASLVHNGLSNGNSAVGPPLHSTEGQWKKKPPGCKLT